MKRLSVIIPAFLLVIFLLNSFVLKEKVSGAKSTGAFNSITTLTLREKSPINPSAKDSIFNPTKDSPELVRSVLKSIDGGRTWQDISQGLPEHEQPVNFFAGESDVYLYVNNGMYRSESNFKAPVWEKENVPDPQHASIAFNPSGVMAFNYNGQIYQKMTPGEVWSPVHANFKKQSMRTVFETSDETIFLGYDHGLYKSADKGKNWKQVQNEGWVMNIVESEGILVAAGQKGIMRSIDNGEHWEWVIKEGGVGIAIERINGGFAAITASTKTSSRRVHLSLDSGRSWQAIDDGLRPSLFVSSIKQMGKYLILGHPDGIYRSSDMGKTWNSVLPGINEHSSLDKEGLKFTPTWNSTFSERPGNVFRIYVSGNVVYAVAGGAGC